MNLFGISFILYFRQCLTSVSALLISTEISSNEKYSIICFNLITQKPDAVFITTNSFSTVRIQSLSLFDKSG